MAGCLNFYSKEDIHFFVRRYNSRENHNKLEKSRYVNMFKQFYVTLH